MTTESIDLSFLGRATVGLNLKEQYSKSVFRVRCGEILRDVDTETLREWVNDPTLISRPFLILAVADMFIARLP